MFTYIRHTKSSYPLSSRARKLSVQLYGTLTLPMANAWNLSYWLAHEPLLNCTDDDSANFTNSFVILIVSLIPKRKLFFGSLMIPIIYLDSSKSGEPLRMRSGQGIWIHRQNIWRSFKTFMRHFRENGLFKDTFVLGKRIYLPYTPYIRNCQ